MGRRWSRGSPQLMSESGNLALPLPRCVTLAMSHHLCGPLFHFHAIGVIKVHGIGNIVSECFLNETWSKVWSLAEALPNQA